MKKNIQKFSFVLLSLVLCLLFGGVLLIYTVPMQNISYDFSLMFEGEAMPEDWVYDQKDWTVFIQEEDNITPLTSDGFGGFTGLNTPGQTFYYSRILKEELDSPTLQINTADQNLAVFLDGKLLYTDCPEQDNRMGYLSLPMSDYYKTDPILLSLPADYQGKTLTIAQSSGSGEKKESSATVWPCSVSLYCGYFYESELIAESFRTAIPAVLSFAAGAVLLGFFLWQVFTSGPNIRLPFLALTAFLWSLQHVTLTSFSSYYFGDLSLDIPGLSRLFSLTVLFVFLTSLLHGKKRLILSLLVGIQGITVLLTLIPDMNSITGFAFQSIPQELGILCFIALLFCAVLEWRKGHSFFSLFCPMVAIEFFIYIIAILISPSLGHMISKQFWLGAEGYFLWWMMTLIMPAAMFCCVMEIISNQISRRADTRLLKQQYELAQSGFENLRRHHEEIMMLRHDMVKHLTYLRQSSSDQHVIAYLDELIGQQQDLRPVVQSRNKTLDIILNAKLSEASDQGIKVEILRLDPPEQLPLSDVELCTLIMNIMDNSIAAASKAGVKDPFIRLDMHQKDNFFVFYCENNAEEKETEKTAEKETMEMHGLGLKIINQIIEQHGNLMEIEQTPGLYRITVAISLHQPLK